MGAGPASRGDHRGLKRNVHTQSLGAPLACYFQPDGERRMFTHPPLPSVGRGTFHFTHPDELHYR